METVPPAWLVVGLGNPGPIYAQTRHNVGYWLANGLARRWDIPLRARRLCAVGQGRVDGRPVLLAKPRTYVNQSGHAISALMKQHRLEASHLLVICDDLDLPIGRIRLRPGGGHGGHNGLRSIISALATTDFPRLRIGIGRPQLDGQPVTDPDLVAVYVLSNPTSAEREALEAALARGMEAVEAILREGLEAAMNRYNR